MKSLNPEIFSYVDNKSGSWAESTIHTAYHKLCTISKFGFEPKTLYTELKKSGHAPYTIKTYFILAASYEQEVLKSSKIQNWIKDNRLLFKNTYREKTKRITKEQYRNFLDQAPNKDVYNLLVLMGLFGLRKSEAFNAKWTDFTPEGLWVVGKGDKQRNIPLYSLLLKEPQASGLILPSNLTYQEFIKPFTPHDFRAYAITYWVSEKGLNVKEAAILAGHSSITTTDRYIRTDLTQIGAKLK